MGKRDASGVARRARTFWGNERGGGGAVSAAAAAAGGGRARAARVTTHRRAGDVARRRHIDAVELGIAAALLVRAAHDALGVVQELRAHAPLVQPVGLALQVEEKREEAV